MFDLFKPSATVIAAHKTAMTFPPPKSVAEISRAAISDEAERVADRIAELERRRALIIEELNELRPISLALTQAIAMVGEAPLDAALTQLEKEL